MHTRTLSLTLPSGTVIPIEISTARRNGDWFVAAQANIDGAPVRFAATASEAMIRAALQKLGKAGAASTGGVFDNLGKHIARFARSRALQNVLQSIATVARNPMVRQIAGFYGPMQTALDYIGKGANAAAAAQGLLLRTKQGDPKALSAIRQITAGARQGNPNAQLMHRVLSTVHQAAKRENAQATFASTDNLQQASGPPVSAGAVTTSDPDLLALARTVRATG